MIGQMNKSLEFLRDKYGFPPGTIGKNDDFYLLELPDGSCAELLPCRVERRIVELKKMIESATLEDLSTLRFAKFTPGGSLRRVLAAELDLAEYLASSPAVRIFGCGDGKSVCNCIVRFANGISASLECGTRLPAGAKEMDRHEIIARRGVGCDRAVDTQVPQHSIYLWNDEGSAEYTDVDTELFGLSDEAVWNVRAACALLKEPALIPVWQTAAERSLKLADAALRSAAENMPVILNEEDL